MISDLIKDYLLGLSSTIIRDGINRNFFNYYADGELYPTLVIKDLIGFAIDLTGNIDEGINNLYFRLYLRRTFGEVLHRKSQLSSFLNNENKQNYNYIWETLGKRKLPKSFKIAFYLDRFLVNDDAGIKPHYVKELYWIFSLIKFSLEEFNSETDNEDYDYYMAELNDLCQDEYEMYNIRVGLSPSSDMYMQHSDNLIYCARKRIDLQEDLKKYKVKSRNYEFFAGMLSAYLNSSAKYIEKKIKPVQKDYLTIKTSSLFLDEEDENEGDSDLSDYAYRDINYCINYSFSKADGKEDAELYFYMEDSTVWNEEYSAWLVALDRKYTGMYNKLAYKNHLEYKQNMNRVEFAKKQMYLMDAIKSEIESELPLITLKIKNYNERIFEELLEVYYLDTYFDDK